MHFATYFPFRSLFGNTEEKHFYCTQVLPCLSQMLLTLEWCNLDAWFFWWRLSQHPENWKTQKGIYKYQFKGVKNSKKGEGGGDCHGNGSQIFRYYKTLLKSEKIFPKHLTSFFGCCRRPNIWFVTLLSLSPSSSFAPSSTRPFFIYLEYLHMEKTMDMVEIWIWIWRKW